jgi:hypothetical protein
MGFTLIQWVVKLFNHYIWRDDRGGAKQNPFNGLLCMLLYRSKH